MLRPRAGPEPSARGPKDLRDGSKSAMASPLQTMRVLRRSERSEGKPTMKVCNLQPPGASPRRLAIRPAASASAACTTTVAINNACRVSRGGNASPVISSTLSYAVLLTASLVRATMPPSRRRNQNHDGRTTPERFARAIRTF